MSERFTRKDAEQAFERLLSALGKRRASGPSDVGGWRLDYAPIYGGFNIEEISNVHGGVSQPFGSARYSARDFWAMVNFTLDALETFKRGL